MSTVPAGTVASFDAPGWPPSRAATHSPTVFGIFDRSNFMPATTRWGNLGETSGKPPLASKFLTH